METSSDKITKLMKEQNFTYAQLAAKTGIPKSALQRYATNATLNIPAQRIKAIAQAFGVTAEYLLGWENNSVSNENGETEELDQYLEELRTRPEMRMFFSLTKNANKKDVEDAVRIVEAYLKTKESE